MDTAAKKRELLKVMNALLKSEGWTSVLSFTRDSGVPYTIETTRRAFVEVRDKNLAPATLAIILKYLNRSPQEIRGILMTYTDDKDLYPLIGEGEEKYTVAEDAVVASVRKMLAAKPEVLSNLVSALEVLALAAGVDISDEVKRLKRKPKGG